MEYQKIENLLNIGSNQPYKFRTRNWVEINDESKGTYTSSDTGLILRSNLGYYADATYLLWER